MRREWARNMLFVGALCVVAALLVACGSAASAGEAAEIRLTEADAGSQIELKPGQALVVELPSNPSTGYGWQQSAGDQAVLKPVGEVEFRQAATSGNVVGAGGTEVLRFEAAGTGTTTLNLVYHRPWEEGVEPLQQFTVEVVVR
ncbi:MAG: protease inhibitor I42 family protein [Anaerolineae bacterium]|nr:protease inhibitor I42 family protein [Anaerolineae bacterium]